MSDSGNRTRQAATSRDPSASARAGASIDRGEPTLIVLPNSGAVSMAAAERFATIAEDAVSQRGRADIATTGGSTPAGIYHHLTDPPLRDHVPWDRLHLWWGDDRFVPRDDVRSNIRAVDEILLGGPHDHRVPLPDANLHPFPVGEAREAGHDADWCAERYEDELRAALPISPSGWPVFDLVLVGIGPDGHLLSIFPGSDAFERTEWVLRVPAPTHLEPMVERVTLNPAILDVAASLLVVSYGASKASIVARLLGQARDERRWPAQRARRTGAIWLLDAAAARAIPRAGGLRGG